MKKTIYILLSLFFLSNSLPEMPLMAQTLSEDMQQILPYLSSTNVLTEKPTIRTGEQKTSTALMGASLSFSEADVSRLNLNLGGPAHEEVDLTQGKLKFSDIDLTLPGIGGHDLVLSRSYNSSFFKSKTLLSPLSFMGKSGQGFGHGWGLNLLMRAYIMNNGQTTSGNGLIANRNYQKVVIETNEGISEYFYDGNLGAFVSKQPGNFNRVYVSNPITYFAIKEPYARSDSPDTFPQDIRLETPDGTTYIFGQNFFYYWGGDKNRLSGAENLPWVAIMGKSLTKICKGYQQITLEYENGGTTDYNLLAAYLFPILGDVISEADFYFHYQVVGSDRFINGDSVQYVRLKKITDTSNRIINFEYVSSSPGLKTEQDGQISKITYTGPNGAPIRIQYAYDLNNNLSEVTIGDTYKKTYTYSSFDYGRGANGFLLSGVKTALGTQIAYTYINGGENNGSYIPIETLSPLISSKKITADGKSWITQFLYNTTGLGVKHQQFKPTWSSNTIYSLDGVTIDNPSFIADEVLSFTNGLIAKKTMGPFETVMEWDLDKRIPKKTILKRNGQIQEETLINDYDDYNNPLSITHKKSGLTDLQTTLTYYYPEPGVGDSSIVDWNFNRRYILGRIKSKETVSPEGRTNAFFYTYWNNKIASICEGRDSSGKLLKEMRYFYNGRIQTQTLYGPNGPLTTQFNYMDAPSKQTITQTTNGKTSTIELEGFTGKPIKITGINGGITTYAYDAYGRVISATGPDNIPITYSYSSDLKTTTVTGGGRTVASTVDSMGRTILVDNPSGEEDIKTDYYYGDLPLAVYTGTNTWTLKKSYTYDDLLRKKTVTSPDFGTTTTSYDDGSNTVTVTDTKGRQTVSYQNELNQTTKTVFVPDNSQTLSTYDNFGRVATTTDPRGLIHKADQDAYGRITKTYFPGTGTLQRTIPTYSQQAPNVVESIAIYDKTGVLSKTYAYAYDVEGRVTQTKLNGTVQETLTYDQGSNGKGHLVQAETPDALSTYTYDSAGRPIQTQTTIKALSKTVQSTYTYNPTNGQVANLTFNDGKALSYTYDSNQKLQSQRYNGLALATYSYNPNGTIAQITLGNGTTLTYTYDKQILLKSITAKTASGTTLYTQTYAYDAQGIPTATQHNDYLFSTGSTINRAWTYDAKNQLTQVQLNQQPQYTYQWDKNGNPTRFESPNNKNLGQPNITVASDQDQIVRKNQADGRYTLYAYDAEGNQISRTRYNPTNQPQTQRTYTYNYQGQLVQAKDDGTTIGTYGYDENRQRIYKKTDATTKWIQWDLAGNQIGEGLATSNTYEVKYLYSGNQKLAMIRTENGQEKTYYFINNAQGTPVIMIDTNNMVVSKINLDEFGNLGPSIKLNANSHEINYTGKKRDPETGLYYFNQRHYDPEIGRFLTEDPAGQCLNPYLYAANSPLVYVDPDGEFFQFLIPLFVSALQAGATSAAINAGMQLALTGKIDGQGVLNAFGSGALSGALSFGVGEMMGHATEGLGKTLAHGVSGGLQSMTSGGSFGSGFVGGAIGNLAAEASNGAGMLEQAGIAGIAGGVTSMAAGGSFANGFQSGAYNVLYNKFGEGLKERLTGFTGKLSHGLSNLDVRLGGSIDVWQFSLNYDRGSGFQKSAQVIPSIGASFYADMVSKGIDERSTVTAGFKYLGLRVINGKSTKFGLGLSAGVGIGLPINYSVPVR